MRKSAKKNYQQVRPMPCRFCGKVIRVDMYRHMARLHLDLVAAVAVPNRLVHYLEGVTPGLPRTCEEWP